MDGTQNKDNEDVPDKEQKPFVILFRAKALFTSKASCAVVSFHSSTGIASQRTTQYPLTSTEPDQFIHKV